MNKVVNYTVYQLPIEDNLVFWDVDFAEEVLERFKGIELKEED